MPALSPATGTRWHDERDSVLGRIAAVEQVQSAHGTAIANLIARMLAVEEALGAQEPPPPPSRVLIGASVNSTPSFPQNWASLEAAIGSLQAVRLFDPTEGADPVQTFRNVAGKGLEIHLSTKSLSTSASRRDAYYAAVEATGEKVVAYNYHEFDDNVAGRSDPTFSYDTWRVAALTDALACQSHGIDYGICMQLYGLMDGGWPEIFEQVLADDELLALTKVFGVDTYQRGNTQFKQATYRPWSYNGDKITWLTTRLPAHLRIALPEFGVPEHPTDAAYRTTYLVDMHAQAVREQWRAVLVYNAYKVPDDAGDNWVSTGPEFLYDTPECREASRAAMAGLVALGNP